MTIPGTCGVRVPGGAPHDVHPLTNGASAPVSDGRVILVFDRCVTWAEGHKGTLSFCHYAVTMLSHSLATLRLGRPRRPFWEASPISATSEVFGANVRTSLPRLWVDRRVGVVYPALGLGVDVRG